MGEGPTGDTRGRDPDWLVRGEQVGLAAPNRDEFVARWDLYDDPRIGMAAAFQSGGAAAIFKPPMTREHREWIWDAARGGLLMPFDVHALADGRFLGEAGVSRIDWPAGSGEIAAAIFAPADRGRGYGTEAMVLLFAYGFDALGMNRLAIRYLSVNDAVVRAVERTAALVGARVVGVEREAEWAYGARRDRLVVECVRDDFPPQPATAHLRGDPAHRPHTG
jgi:RimJ/RimL family protein N-acetyltransferase